MLGSLSGVILASFVLALGLVPLCRAYARRYGYVVKPTADRWHRRDTALFGGVAVFLATIGAVAALVRPLEPLWIYFISGAFIFAVGLADDFLKLKPATKLIAQIAVATLFVFAGYKLNWVESRTLDAILTMVWIVGLTNAFNLIDNMDGLCAGVAILTGASLLAGMMPLETAGPSAGFLAALLGATAGFLVYNRHPASIFLGDSGSLLLGLTLAAMALEVPTHGQPSNVLAVVAGPLLVMMIPIFDTMFVTLLRLLSGRRASQGGRDHTSHRLVAIGLPEGAAVQVLWILSAIGAFAGWTLHRLGADWAVLIVAVATVAMLLFGVLLGRVRVYEGQDLVVMRSGRITPFLVRFMHKRRVAEVILDTGLIAVAYYAAHRLRLDGPDEWTLQFDGFIESLPVAVAIQLVTLFAFGAYRGVWRFFGLMDGVVIGKAVVTGTFLLWIAVHAGLHYQDRPGVFVIYGALMMLLATGSRASFRLMSEFIRRRRQGRRMVIYGAGAGGHLALRELVEQDGKDARCLGFIDDDPSKHGRSLGDYPVLGGHERLAELVRRGGVDQVVIATRKIDEVRINELLRLCAGRDVSLHRLNFNLERLSPPVPIEPSASRPRAKISG
jgi:UDP-GlcNAc:undecaprenyl-phosphate/decaprenyl-phosphate GlcNAc-1-phosphate transferase